jgi:putative peptidoglycan lipid II flippase
MTVPDSFSDSEKSSKSGKLPPASSGLGRASFFVSLGILLSRILGLVRDQVFAHYLGNSPAAGAFRAALRIPNFLQNLFGEGVLSASFIPVYARLRAGGDDRQARELAGTVACILALVVSVLVLLGVSLTPFFVELVAPGFDGELRALTIELVRVLFPGVGLLVLSAWCLGVLNSHRRFFLSYVAPVFWNLALIVTLVYFGRRTTESELVVKLAWGSVVGSFLQFAVQVPFVFQSAGKIPFRFARGLASVAEVFRNLGPVMISRGVVQLSAYVDGMIASYLGAAAVASLAYAQTIYLLPVSLFGMAVAAAELPELSVQAGESPEAHLKLTKRISAGRRRIAFFVVPSAVAFMLLGRPLIEVLYQTGRFGPEDTLFVWYILMGSVIGLLAATWGRLYSSAFYALRDTRTPLRFALLRVGLTIVLGLLFAFPLRPYIILLIELVPGLHVPMVNEISLGLGAVGLTASAGLAGWIEFLLLKRALEKRIGPTPITSGFMGKVWSIAILSGIFILGLDLAIRATVLLSPLGRRFISIGELAAFGVVYLLLALLLRLDEVRLVVSRLLRRFGRKR